MPKQSGTSDTCAASNEEDLLIEQERLQLITVGWIHTHPSQRAFLSSVDLHTHAPYQKMLPEAIAIVVAPTFNDIGTYSLSEYGLESILRCRQSGFHPHPNEASIYGEARHVRIDDSLSVEVVDFRLWLPSLIWMHVIQLFKIYILSFIFAVSFQAIIS